MDNFMYGDVYNTQDLVEIEPVVLAGLKNDSKFLKALRQAGVGDWEGFERAVEIYDAFK